MPRLSSDGTEALATLGCPNAIGISALSLSPTNLSPSRLERVQAPEVALIADGVLAIEPDQNFTEEVCRIADAAFVED